MILSVNQIPKLVNKLKKEKKKIVLVGGCFDVLHPGHVIFLEKAKKEGDILIVLLESDKKVRQLKGKNRPVHAQKERAQVLSALKSVDFCLKLDEMGADTDYDQLIRGIKPDIIAATAGYDDGHHQRVAKLIGAKLKYVTKKIGHYSSSRILSSS